MPRPPSIPDADPSAPALLLGYDLPFTHFDGVCEALDRLGIPAVHEVARGVEIEAETHTQAWAIRSSRVVAVPDDTNTINMAALRIAHRAGIPRVLMMDGLVEFSNTFLNPACGPGFLRPAPVELVCAAGPIDAAVLRALGNKHVAATGLPRVAAFARSVNRGAPSDRGPWLIATANTEAFSACDFDRLAATLGHLRDAARTRGEPVAWRVSDALAGRLGVDRAGGPLADHLATARGVVCTPSTLAAEALSLSIPTAVVNPHPRPLWTTAPVVWSAGSDDRPSEADERLAAQHGHVTRAAQEAIGSHLDGASPVAIDGRATARAAEVFDALAGGVNARLLARCRSALVCDDAPARVADAIADVAGRPRDGGPPAPRLRIEPLSSLPPTPPEAARRIVSLNVCDGSLVGGVATWSCRLGRAMREADPTSDRVFTLLVALQPPGYGRHGLEHVPDDPDVHVVSIDPSQDPVRVLRDCRAAVEAFDPHIVLPNFADLPWAVSAQLRADGVRTVAIAHNDNAYFRAQIGEYADWDVGVAVSTTCERWMRTLAGDRPLHQITYGVPVRAAARRSAFASGQSGRLQLAYIGRLITAQKRVLDLVPLADELRTRGVPFVLHVVGDGPQDGELRAAFAEHGFDGRSVVFHGPRPMSWVEGFLATVDASVLVSDHEGTSISMLEAMGAGVVPCVTRVASGVGDWIRDGENGITAPVGEPRAMAARIAELADSPSEFDRLGAAAHRAVAGELSLERMAERYRAVFDDAMRAEVPSSPTDRGLVLSDGFRWERGSFEDTVGSDALATDDLARAGFCSIGLAPPEPDDDAVLVRSSQLDATVEEINGWRRRGLGVARSPQLKPPGVFERARDRLLGAGVARGQSVAVYGSGPQGRVLGGLSEAGWRLAGFVDDTHVGHGTRWAKPAVALGQLDRLGDIRALVLSSWRHEAAMWVRARRHGLGEREIALIPAHREASDLSDTESQWDRLIDGSITRLFVDGDVRAADAVLDAVNAQGRLAVHPLAESEPAGLGRGDAVLLGNPAGETETFDRLRAAWQAGALALPVCATLRELNAPAEAAARLAGARDAVLVFGAGRQGQRIAARLGASCIGFVDHQSSNAEIRDEIDGRPAYAPADAPRQAFAIVISSLRFADSMRAACGPLEAAGVRVVNPYDRSPVSAPS